MVRAGLERSVRLMIGEDGQDLIEYGLLAGLISVACIASTKSLAHAIIILFGVVTAGI